MKAFFLFLCACSFSVAFGQGKTSAESTPQSAELPTATLEEAGFNRDSIESLIGLIQTTSHKDFRGVVVIKDNHIVIEEYFNTFWRITVNDIRSAGKSVTTLLLGIAIKEGLIESLDQSLYSLFAKSDAYTVNEDYKKIKLRHVLDMSSGLDADTDDPETPGQAGNWMDLEDWKPYLLNVPLTDTPGKKFAYADIHAVLVGMAIEEASGMSLQEYAQEKLFDPLGIKQVYWYTNAANQTGGAGNLYLTTLDFAKLGLLITNQGKYGNQQLIEPDYIESIKNTKNPAIGDWFFMAKTYGMFWYKSSGTFGKHKVDFLFASGNGGNQLIVIPEKNMVIALSASAYGQGYGHGRSYAIWTKIVAAME